MLRFAILPLGLALFTGPALAAVPEGGVSAGSATVDDQRSGALLLAQSGEVEVFYDRYGRRVLLDPDTGEVIAIERPRRSMRRDYDEGWQSRQARRQERRWLDAPDYAEERERIRRPLDVLPPDGSYERPFPGDGPYARYPGDPYVERPQAFPEEPPAAPALPASRASVPAKPAPVERKPLEPAGPAPVPTTQAALPGGDDTQITDEPRIEQPARFSAREEVASLQILVDRAGASPGVIDGKFGSNLDKAIAAYREITGKNLRSTDPEGIKQALAEGGDPFTTYTITSQDVAGPFVASVPEDYGAKAKLERLSYTSTAEMLAERFHMDEAYLKALNPDANFSRVGTRIKVANVGRVVGTQVARLVADKGRKQLRAYDEAGKLVAAYPATIGSSDTPSPSGTHAVSRVALDPQYTYNPKLNFKQGKNDKVLTIPPGPNGPVGSVWIALDKPTYGIHGTPEPSRIGKTESHGCVRLTNWDAQELAKLVKSGVPVEFVE